MTTTAIVQARMGSTRLPGKSMLDIGGRPVVDHVVHRLAKCRTLDGIAVAVPDGARDDGLAAHLVGRGVVVGRGSEDDVLGRVLAVARACGAETIVRVTADCPFIDPGVVDATVARFREARVDYASNVEPRHFPDGLDVEVMSLAALGRADAEARDPFHRLHVTPYIHGRRAGYPHGGFTKVALAAPANFGHLRWTLDEPDDLAFARAVVARLGPDFGWLELVALMTREPELLDMNPHIATNAGAEIDARRLAGGLPRFDRSNQAFARALATIPLASQTFSKSHYQWPRGAAPLFADRAKGGHTWDIDGNRYVDYVLGLLPIVLGHRDPDVDAAARAQVVRGVTLSLPTLLEVEVAERIARHVPCAEKVRFGKNGSDATTAAVRLARAFTGRDRIVVAGYHGWHDWYIGSTTRDLGVPRAVKALTTSVRYNDLDALETELRVRPDAYAAIVMEPVSTVPPAPGYLQGVRDLATQHGVVLVFDEIITGFRIGMGGAQALHGVTPDLACFGKAMANGWPLSALAGRSDIMDRMDDVFVSGTFGGEAVSLAAAIATIDKLEREKVPARLWALGAGISTDFNAAANRHGLGEVAAMRGDGWWPRLTVTSPPVDPMLFSSLARQMFLRHGLLLGAGLNICLSHEEAGTREETRAALDRAFGDLAEALATPDPARALLGETIRNVFSVR